MTRPGPVRRSLPGLASGLSVLASLLLAGCGPKVLFKGGEALLKGEIPPAAQVPDSLRASLELTGYQGLRKTTVSAAFSALPRKRYRMDVYGLPGMVEATFHWADTGWTLVVFGREGYLRGYGDAVDLPGLGLGRVPVHDLFACLWGDFFPGDGASGPENGSADPEAAAAGDTAGAPDATPAGNDGSAGGPLPVYPVRWERSEGVVRYAGDGGGWAAKVEPATGLVREAVREDSAFRILYEDYVLRNGRPLPRRVKVFGGSKPLLEIAVKVVEDNPAWKRDPFLLRIPKGFVRLRPAQGG